MDVTTTEKRTLHHKVVVNHEPPIIVRREIGRGPRSTEKKFAITQSVYSTSADYGYEVHYVSTRHSGHNVRKDGSQGAALRDIYLYDTEYDRLGLARVKAEAVEAIQKANREYVERSEA